ncbi:MAG: hypothetical protein QM541_14295 [Flavobacterium sp.]|nr:hypothetical protein [Flavobacterium sp.]
MKYLILFFSIGIITTNLKAQIKKGNFSFEAHYGLTGNFFVQSYDETSSIGILNDANFFKKNFIGSNLQINTGYYFNKKWKLSLAYTRQENKRDVNFIKAYPNYILNINTTIRHFNNFWDLELTRYYEKKKNRLGISLGASYMRFRQNEIDILIGGRAINIEERDAKRFKLVDLDAVLGCTYDYKIQPKVYVGVATKFHYNITADIAESVSLSPYVHFYF